jgi:hypothetical protein
MVDRQDMRGVDQSAFNKTIRYAIEMDHIEPAVPFLIAD